MDTYKIVNATELDANLESLANSFREKRNEASSKKYNFPESFTEALRDMYYDEAPNTADDLVVEGKTVKVGKGYYPNEVSKSVANGSISSVTVSGNAIQFTPNITFNESTGQISVAPDSETRDIVVNVQEGYQNSDTKTYSNKVNATLNSATKNLTLKTDSDVTVIVNGNKVTVTIPKGYYASQIVKEATTSTSQV